MVRGHREFFFKNTWGGAWGKHGFGALSYDYIDKYAFESWVAYNTANTESAKVTRAWSARSSLGSRDEWHRRIYGFEVWDEAGKDRLAWAFVLERTAPEIEELYVRPEFRRKGYGRAAHRESEGAELGQRDNRFACGSHLLTVDKKTLQTTLRLSPSHVCSAFSSNSAR